ncbi:MAG: ABC transporter permease [Christensenellaceae bacterium]|jgi:ABC-2 type transport system permease protein
MKNLYKYRVKTIINDRGNMFWTLIFPLLLATLFQITFGQALQNSESFETIPVAVVQQSEEGSYFKETLDELASGDDPFLSITYTNEADAQTMLEEEAVSGIYILSESEPELVVRTDGLMPSMLKNVLDSFIQIESTITNLAETNPAQIADAIEPLANPQSVTEQVQLSDGSLNFFVQNFYALIAMACLYGSFFGLSGALALQPGLSPLGVRKGVTPTKKSLLVASDILAAITVMFAIIIILFLYLKFVLQVDLGQNIPAMLLTCLLGVFAGVMLGVFVGVAFRMKPSVKDGILIGFSLLLCFFGGLMYPNMRYMVEQSAPVLNRINPAALMVDSFYSLDTYGVGDRYFMNNILLAAIGVILFAISVLILRRKQYASV